MEINMSKRATSMVILNKFQAEQSTCYKFRLKGVASDSCIRQRKKSTRDNHKIDVAFIRSITMHESTAKKRHYAILYFPEKFHPSKTRQRLIADLATCCMTAFISPSKNAYVIFVKSIKETQRILWQNFPQLHLIFTMKENRTLVEKKAILLLSNSAVNLLRNTSSILLQNIGSILGIMREEITLIQTNISDVNAFI